MRAKKDGVFLTAKLARDVSDSLTQYSEDTGLSKTVIIEKALRAYFSNAYAAIPVDMGSCQAGQEETCHG